MSDPKELPPKPSMIVGLYKHYKGDLYSVIDLVSDSTNGRGQPWVVLYTSIKTYRMHVRDYDEFTGEVSPGVKRFTLVKETPLLVPPGTDPQVNPG